MITLTTNKIKIAFVNPPHADWSLANNAAYLMFQSYYLRHGKYPNNVQWMPAPYKFNSYKNIEEIYNEVAAADIYLLSSYVWNYDICDSLTQHIKEINPNAICVLGGPHIGTNDPVMLNNRNFYDFILKSTKSGEIFISDLIDSYVKNTGSPDYGELAWELRSDKTCEQFMPDYSIYEEHIDYLTETREYARVHNMEPFCILETTRGCPYSCSFCEWGGGIGSKVYKKPFDIVQRDILALKKSGFRDIYLTDANFGMFFERDLEIFKFAWSNGINLTDISTVKSRNLKKRIDLINAWFEVVGTGGKNYSSVDGITNDLFIPKLAEQIDIPRFISIVPNVSLQSVSDEAMRVAKRVDLSFEDKIKLSEHINFKCQEQGFPVPSLELILGMPGSTIDDFYEELNVLWNFQSWGSYRHDYMFLPDADLSDVNYIEQYKIKLVEVYSDLIDESGIEHNTPLYKHKKQHFKTIAACYSYTKEEFYEMWFMNVAGNYLLKHIYPLFVDVCAPSTFGRLCYLIISKLDGFDLLMNEIKDLLDPNTPPRNCKRLQGRLRSDTVNDFIIGNYKVICSELFIHIDSLVDPVHTTNKKIIPIMNTQWN